MVAMDLEMDTDGRRDFDLLHGRWRIHNRRLAKWLQGCTEWLEFEAVGEVRPVLGGLGNTDSYSVAAWSDGRPYEGMTVRLFDPESKLWSIYWASNRTGRLEPPVVGRFEAGLGEFFGDDVFDGNPIRARLTWADITATSAHWEQAFSVDSGQTWETNWHMDLTRVD
jgi:hypothetical protein